MTTLLLLLLLLLHAVSVKPGTHYPCSRIVRSIFLTPLNKGRVQSRVPVYITCVHGPWTRVVCTGL